MGKMPGNLVPAGMGETLAFAQAASGGLLSSGKTSVSQYLQELIEDLALPFFGDQLLEMVHDLVAPSHDRLNF